MARLTIDQLIRRLELLPNTFLDPKVKIPLAKKAMDIIYKRTKSGYGSDNTSKQRLAPLSKSYKDYRAGKAYFFSRNGKVIRVPQKSNRLGRYGTGEFFSPGRSNLTMTGQMLDNIGYQITATGFKIFIKDTSRKDSPLTNKQVAELVETKRPFMALNTGEQLILKRELINTLRDVIKNQGL